MVTAKVNSKKISLTKKSVAPVVAKTTKKPVTKAAVKNVTIVKKEVASKPEKAAVKTVVIKTKPVSVKKEVTAVEVKENKKSLTKAVSDKFVETISNSTLVARMKATLAGL